MRSNKLQGGETSGKGELGRSFSNAYSESARETHLLTILFCAGFLSCSDVGVTPPSQEEPLPIIPTTIAAGPGGPAYMRGTLSDYLKPERSATNTHLYLMNRNDYTDTLLHVLVNSTDASFLITELPVDTIDLIVVGTTFLSAKISSLILWNNHNSFDNLGNVGLWVDSTLYMVAVADSVPRPNMPQVGILGYVNGLGVRFDPGIQEGQALTILSALPYDTLRAFPDSINGILFYVIYPRNTNSLISERLLYFNWLPEIWEAGSVITVVNPLNRYTMLVGKEVVEMSRSR